MSASDKNALPLLSLVTHLYKGLTVDKNKTNNIDKGLSSHIFNEFI